MMRYWRCKSVDLEPWEGSPDEDEDEPELLLCRACRLLMSEGEDV